MNNPMTATFVQPLAMPKALSVKEDKCDTFLSTERAPQGVTIKMKGYSRYVT